MSVNTNTMNAYADVTYASDHKDIGDRYLGFLCLVLVGYAVGARGFAYVGLPPLYIGEIALLFGLLALCYSRSLGKVFLFSPAKLLVVVMVWGFLCTVPYLPIYRLDAARDAMAYGYGVFAFITAALLIDKPDRFRILFIRYRHFAVVFLAIMWVLFLLNRTAYLNIPHFPGAPVSLISTTGGPIMVHVAGAAAFILVGLARPSLMLYAFIGLEFFILGVVKRSGMLAFLAAIAVVFTFKHPEIKFNRLAVGVGAVLIVVAVLSPFADITTKSRSISVDQMWTNVLSMTTDQEFEGSNVEGTIEWRLDWWRTIIGYTINGEYFWMGKGFGVNLAEDDGYLKQKSVKLGAPTRNPHNSHLMMLARSGVPGFFFWLILQLSWSSALLRACLESRRAGDYAWSGIFLFLLAYWTAFMTEATFNNSVETPYQGIWFWTLFGVGIAALHIYRTHPEIAWD